jgi:hypothetical protein
MGCKYTTTSRATDRSDVTARGPRGPRNAECGHPARSPNRMDVHSPSRTTATSCSTDTRLRGYCGTRGLACVCMQAFFSSLRETLPSHRRAYKRHQLCAFANFVRLTLLHHSHGSPLSNFCVQGSRESRNPSQRLHTRVLVLSLCLHEGIRECRLGHMHSAAARFFPAWPSERTRSGCQRPRRSRPKAMTQTSSW